MKNKTISKKLKASLHLIDTINNKEITVNEDSKIRFEDHVSNYNSAVELKNEIELLKKDLKLKEKEIIKVIKKLSKSRKDAKETLRKSKKAVLVSVSGKNTRNGSNQPKSDSKSRKRRIIRAKVK